MSEHRMSWTFSRDAIRAFRFVRCGFDATTGVARLVYAFDDGPELTETITIPGAPFRLEGARAEAAQRALRLLHLLAGVSYYKAAVPADIRIEGATHETERADVVAREGPAHSIVSSAGRARRL